jgi:hypothetical protein
MATSIDRLFIGGKSFTKFINRFNRFVTPVLIICNNSMNKSLSFYNAPGGCLTTSPGEMVLRINYYCPFSNIKIMVK